MVLLCYYFEVPVFNLSSDSSVIHTSFWYLSWISSDFTMGPKCYILLTL